MKYPKNKNLTIHKYSEFYETISLINTNHTPRNLTGYIAIGQMKREYTSKFGIQIQCTIPNPINGVVQLTLSSAMTGQFENEYSNNNSMYVYDVVIKNITTNAIEKIQSGTIFIQPGVTNLYDPNVEINIDPSPEDTFFNDFLDGGFFT